MTKLENAIGPIPGIWALYYMGPHHYPDLLYLKENGLVLSKDYGKWSMRGTSLCLHDCAGHVKLALRFEGEPGSPAVFKGTATDGDKNPYFLYRAGVPHPLTERDPTLKNISGAAFLKKLNTTKDFSVSLHPGERIAMRFERDVSRDAGGNAPHLFPPRDYDAPPVYFHVLNNAKMLGGWGIERADGKYLIETSFISDLTTAHGPLKLFPDYYRKTEVYENIEPGATIEGTSFYFDHANAYYHFIFQSLPNFSILDWLEEQGVDLKKIKFLLRAGFQISDIRTALDCGGYLKKIPESSFIDLSKQPSSIRLEKLIYPSYLSSMAPYFFTPPIPFSHYAMVPSLRTTFEDIKVKALARIPVAQRSDKKLIFIHRRKSTRRTRMLNEPELLKALEPLGFVDVDTAELDFVRKIDVFNGARVVVACTGGGVANAVFCRPGAFVLEFMGSQMLDPHNARLAKIMDLRYAVMNFPTVFMPDDDQYMWVDHCFRADVPMIVESVKKILARVSLMS